MSTSGVRQDGTPQPGSSHQDRTFSQGSKALSSLSSCETGEGTSQTQTTVRVSFLAVLKITLQGDHARHDVQVAQGSDRGRWLLLRYSEGREVRGGLHGSSGQHGYQEGEKNP